MILEFEIKTFSIFFFVYFLFLLNFVQAGPRLYKVSQLISLQVFILIGHTGNKPKNWFTLPPYV